MTRKDPQQHDSPHGERTNGTSVLFVCLGNICRSPLAEGVFQHLLEQAGLDGQWRVESAGTAAYHVGDRADPRSCAVAAENGITLSGVARKLRPADFDDFDYIIGMDRQNIADIEALRATKGGGGKADIRLLREFDPRADGDREVPDPYYGGDDGFQRVYKMVYRSCLAFLEEATG